MATICPTVLASDPHSFGEQMEKIAPFAERVQIDLTDGEFAQPKSVDLEHVWWPHSVKADIHLMYKNPAGYLDKAIELGPHMLIIHAEAHGDFDVVADKLHERGIKVGVALLHDTPASLIQSSLSKIDHVLIFSGDLGHYGGKADLSLLNKAKDLRAWKPELEIGWDGGINDQNAAELAKGGVDVLNVGGFIQNSSNPEAAYVKIEEAIKEK